MVGQKNETQPQLLLWPTEICSMIIRIHYLRKEVMHAKYVPNRTKCNSPSAKQHTLPKAYRLGNLLSTLASLLNTESKQSFSSNRQSLQECGSSSEKISPHPSMIALCSLHYHLAGEQGKSCHGGSGTSRHLSMDHACGGINVVMNPTTFNSSGWT